MMKKQKKILKNNLIIIQEYAVFKLHTFFARFCVLFSAHYFVNFLKNPILSQKLNFLFANICILKGVKLNSSQGSATLVNTKKQNVRR